MAIKNKDGTNYELRKPNPLVSNQNQWHDFILHNCTWENNISEKEKKVIPIITEIKVREPEIEEEEIQESPEIVESVKKEETRQDIPKEMLEKMIIMYCLPAKVDFIKDEIYDEDRPVVTYQFKFTLEGVILEENDLNMKFWTQVELSEESIIYPYKSLRTEAKFSQFRWWKIHTTSKQQDGCFYFCIPSHKQPNFFQ